MKNRLKVALWSLILIAVFSPIFLLGWRIWMDAQ